MAQNNNERPQRPSDQNNPADKKPTKPTEKRAPGEAEELDQELQPAEQNPAPKGNQSRRS